MCVYISNSIFFIIFFEESVNRLNPRGNGDNENFVNTRATIVTYLECRKNVAQGAGGHAVDGCQDFIASPGEEGAPSTLICGACGCNRSFHRKLVTVLSE